MSMCSWTEEGYGFPLWTGKNFKTVCDFIVAHMNEPLSNEDRNVLDSICKEQDEFELEMFLDDPASSRVAEIINEQEGTRIFRGFRECGDTNQEQYLGAEPWFPWELSENDRQLTRGDVDRILDKYAVQLGINEPPEYFTAHYFG